MTTKISRLSAAVLSFSAALTILCAQQPLPTITTLQPDFSIDTGAPPNLYRPVAVHLDKDGNLIIADVDNQRVRRVMRGSNLVSTIAGNGTWDLPVGEGGGPLDAALGYPFDAIADSSGNIYIADEVHSCIRKVAVGANPTYQDSCHPMRS